MQAVIAVPTPAVDAPWPVSSPVPGSWLALHGGCTDAEVALFVAALAALIDVDPPCGRDEVVDALLREEFLIAAGGLRLVDPDTGAAVVPGCCAGLEEWREWTQVLIGGPVWLGHDPGPEVEVRGDRLRVWQDGGSNRHLGLSTGVHVDLSRTLLPGLLMSVQRDLVGFLTAFAAWAGRIGLEARGTALVQAIDKSLAVSAPLDLPVTRVASPGGDPETMHLT